MITFNNIVKVDRIRNEKKYANVKDNCTKYIFYIRKSFSTRRNYFSYYFFKSLVVFGT